MGTLGINGLNSVSSAGKSVRVLLVDDDPQVLKVVKRTVKDVVETQGDTFIPRSFYNSEDALKALDNESFDFLLTDGDVPNEGDGVDIVKKAASKGFTPLQILMLSGNDNLKSKVSGKASFLGKIQIIKLADTVRNMLYPKAKP